MPWLRIGDNASTHPLMSKLLAATNLEHHRKNEAFGVLVQLAAVSAGHLTDSIVEFGLLAQTAPGRERAVLDALKDAGIATEEQVDERMVIRLVLDDEEFIHAKRKEEVELDRRRAKDKRTPGLLAQVRLRDGDRCRWCGKSVSWTNRSGYRAATYDSLNNHEDSTVDTLVIACKTCNSKRGAGQELTLLHPPTQQELVYGEHTVRFINNDPWCQHNGIHIEPTQQTLPIDMTQAAAASRQQQDDRGAAPSVAAASDVRAAPGRAAPESADGDEPWWMTNDIAEPKSTHSPGAAPQMAAAQAHELGGDQAAAASRQQQDDRGAAPSVAAASDVRAAPGRAAPDTTNHTKGNGKVTELGRDPGRRGDVSRTVGSGRLGMGRTGHAGSGRRRRGKRGGR